MSFISRINFSGRIAEVVRRFPVAMLFALITTLTLIWVVDKKSADLFRWPLAGYIGFLAMFNWTIFKETFGLSQIKYWAGVVVICVLLGIYYTSIPANSQTEFSCFWFFTAGLSSVLHFTVSFLPFIKKRDNTAFTHYNTKVFLSWVQSAVYGIVFYLALSLAILALDKLFDIRLDSIVYFKLFILVTGIIQTPFFLSEFPDDYYTAEAPAQKSVFKILTSYVLIPVTAGFGLIIYAYLGRVLLTGHEMVDWTFVMVLWFLFTGLLTWLFAAYFQNGSDNNWMSTYRKWFPVSAIIPVLMMLYSLYKVIDLQGIREEFYFAAFLAAFSLITVLYLSVRNDGDKRIIPWLLAALAVVMFMGGPFSICNVPVKSQQKKLVSDFTRQGVIKEGSLQIDTAVFYQDTNGMITNRLYFLESRKALGFLKPYDNKAQLHKDADSISAFSVIQLLRLNRVKAANEELFWSIYSPNKKVISISGFDKLIPVKNNEETTDMTEYLITKDDGSAVIYLTDTTVTLPQFSQSLYDLSLKPDAPKTMEMESGGYHVRIVINSVNGEKRNNKLEINNMDALVFIKKKSDQ
jgi:hypothetical protein